MPRAADFDKLHVGICGRNHFGVCFPVGDVKLAVQEQDFCCVLTEVGREIKRMIIRNCSCRERANGSHPPERHGARTSQFVPRGEGGGTLQSELVVKLNVIASRHQLIQVDIVIARLSKQIE